ncbi:569_t:CDS:2 [Entrophospora sp. SA101]|nr:569_t:CDS:2 [Entrophospora sp. SA101]CAJ0823439.1 5417_t:CDS:2 [Entrophospora sp. SA101]CAJ0823450.1 5424_t:CDS:2 [Entrophospora sp. SA101]CAJ0823461.1 5430_t:CDS:2 [Entrophospora sp. SA101]CAJ0856658.1 2129_t:CDS:2 [Entrophospora sp. SA101]
MFVLTVFSNYLNLRDARGCGHVEEGYVTSYLVNKRVMNDFISKKTRLWFKKVELNLHKQHNLNQEIERTKRKISTNKPLLKEENKLKQIPEELEEGRDGLTVITPKRLKRITEFMEDSKITLLRSPPSSGKSTLESFDLH